MLTELFCNIDDFCNIFLSDWIPQLLTEKAGKNFTTCRMTLSEIMTITVFFHFSHYRNFKHYYNDHVRIHLNKEFPKLLSYNRFVEVMQQATLPLLVFLKKFLPGKCTGISFVDSTKLKVSHNRRIHQHKTFKGVAQRGKDSTGWYYGFKLHLLVNEIGQILNFSLTPGNVDDRDRNVFKDLTKNVFGKLFGDKGYISTSLTEELFENQIDLIVKPRKNMKEKLLPIFDKIMLRKRAVIETVNDELKNICQVEHSRHRSLANFLVNLLSGLVAYAFKPKKPSINLTAKDLKYMQNLPTLTF